MSKEMTTEDRRNDALSKHAFYKAFYVAMVITALGTVGIMGGITILSVAQPKISIATYHFNVQYRAGYQDAMRSIVNNSLLPILDMYYRHPTWKANIEFQAQMLEEIDLMDNLTISNHSLSLYDNIQQRSGRGMGLLQYLVNRGQIELIVMQYSDALAVAYPYLAWYKSLNYTQYLLRHYNLNHVCRAVLLQEGQFFFGLSRAMADFTFANGTPIYDTILGLREILSYYHVQAQSPMYTWTVHTNSNATLPASTGGDTFKVLPYWILPSEEADALAWSIWCQDGENVDTGFNTTYVAEGFLYSPVKLQNHEQQIAEMEAEGNVFMTVDEWENYLSSQGPIQPLDNYVTETNWQAFSYRGAFRWMGLNSGGDTDDGQILAMLYRTFQQLQAVEILLNYSFFKVHSLTFGEYQQQFAILEDAWIRLADGSGTDVTGLSPGWGESYHAYRQAGYALGNATEVKNFILNHTPFLNDTINGTSGTQGFQVVPFNYTPLVQWNHADQSLVSNAIWNATIVTDPSQFINFTRVGVASSSDLSPVTITRVNTLNFNLSLNKIETASIANYPALANLTYYAVDLNFARDNDSTNASLNQPDWQYISFNGDFSKISYSPTMYENDTIMLNRTDYYPDVADPYGDWSGSGVGSKSTLTDNFEIYLPLSNGLVYSENGHFAIVKNTTAAHIVAKWNTNNLRFMQVDTNNETGPAQFFVLTSVSRETALAFANLVNTWKPVTIKGGALP